MLAKAFRVWDVGFGLFAISPSIARLGVESDEVSAPGKIVAFC